MSRQEVKAKKIMGISVVLNSFLLSESISYQWFKQMAYCVLDFHIKNNDKKHKEEILA